MTKEQEKQIRERLHAEIIKEGGTPVRLSGLAEASPTGAPVISPAVVPWLVGIVAVAGALSEVLPEHTIGAYACRTIFFIGSALGLVSPGLRKK